MVLLLHSTVIQVCIDHECPVTSIQVMVKAHMDPLAKAKPQENMVYNLMMCGFMCCFMLPMIFIWSVIKWIKNTCRWCWCRCQRRGQSWKIRSVLSEKNIFVIVIAKPKATHECAEAFFLYYCFFWKAILCEKSDYFRPFSSLPAQDSVDFTTVNMFSVLDLLQMETMVKSVYFNLAPILRRHSNHWHIVSHLQVMEECPMNLNQL